MSQNDQDVPLVTVVVPCYNHVRFVEKAIESVLKQSYPRVQLVVIDDGSSDGSADLIAELASAHGFECLQQQNAGICRTLNRAIQTRARGSYIALLASDDFWHPEKIASQVEALSNSPKAELAFSQAIEFTDEKRIDEGPVFPAHPKHGRMLRSVFFRQHVPAGTLLFSRRLYDELGGFDESLKEEDWDFVIRAAAATEFVSVSRPLLFYRSHASNTMKTRRRAAIFQQKALILSKNFHLVSPWIWLSSVLGHFLYDLVWCPLRARIK